MTTDAHVYRLQLALGASGLAGAVLVLALGVSTVHVTPTNAHLLAVGGMRFTYPALNAAAAMLLALALLGAIVLAVTLRAALRQLREHRRLIRALPVGGTLPGHPTVSVVRAPTPLAFSANPSGDVVGISPERIDSLLGKPPKWQLPWRLLAAALITFGVLLALVWRTSGSASIAATLNLPIASSQPCVLVLALVPVVACMSSALSRT